MMKLVRSILMIGKGQVKCEVIVKKFHRIPVTRDMEPSLSDFTAYGLARASAVV